MASRPTATKHYQRDGCYRTSIYFQDLTAKPTFQEGGSCAFRVLDPIREE